MTVQRTRVKFCGLVRPQDVDTAVALGVDAVGFVFYPKSARCVTLDEAAVLRRRLPSWVRAVGLFVNESLDAMREGVRRVGLDVVQAHGDETAQGLAALGGQGVRYWKALRIGGQVAAEERLRGCRQDGCRRKPGRWMRRWGCSGRRNAVCWTVPVRVLVAPGMRLTGRCWRGVRRPGRPVTMNRVWCWLADCDPRRWARRSVRWGLLRWMCPAGFRGTIQGRKTRLEWSVS